MNIYGKDKNNNGLNDLEGMEIPYKGKRNYDVESVDERESRKTISGVGSVSINDVYESYKKHLYIEDTHLIDVSLATYITKDLPEDPLWLFPLGASGIGKTTIVSPLIDMARKEENCIEVIDSITPAYLYQLGEKLQKKKYLILIPDLAGLISQSQEIKIELFAALRTLFDGGINRKTGTEKWSSDYKDCHTNLLAFGIPNLKDDISLMSLMGTREILYEIPKPLLWKDMFKYHLDDDGRREIGDSVKKLLSEKPLFKEPEPRTIAYLEKAAEDISVWRSEPVVNFADGYIRSPLSQEVPVRVFKQLKKLWMGMETLGIEEKQRKKVIETINRNCGNKIRSLIFNKSLGQKYFGGFPVEDEYKTATLQKIHEDLNCDIKTVRIQLMALREMGKVEPYHEKDMDPPRGIYEPDGSWKRTETKEESDE